MFKVTLSPSNETIYVNDELSLLEHLRRNDIYVKSGCGGHASCTDCIVKVLDGSDALNEPTQAETKLLGNVFHITKERLACQTIISGEVTIDLTGHSKEVVEEKREAKNKKVSSAFANKPKPGSFKVRKKQEIEEIMNERKEKSEERDARKEDWKNHWEKEERKMKRLGGGKRPKGIKVDYKEEDKAENKEEGEE